MTLDECQSVLAQMEATWPKSASNPWTDEQVVVWLRTLAPIRADDAADSLDACRETCKFLPSHAEFTQFASAARRARESYEDAQRRAISEAAGPPASPTTAQHYLAEMRQKLGVAKGPLAKGLRKELGV
ncbi:MAG: hypothetical protein LC798_21000 [Chloroflexi bacterium]|nr:hypothetical protein [Chloroflexota bacterium]